MNYENKIHIQDKHRAKTITGVITLRDTEQRVLNYMLLSLENYDYVNCILDNADFTFLVHKKVFHYLYKDNDLLPKETNTGKFDIKGLEEFINMVASLLEEKENIKYSSTVNILSKEPSIDIQKDINLLKHYSFEKAIALNEFELNRIPIDIIFEDLNSYTKARFFNNRLWSVITTNIEEVPSILCDTAINTIKFLETIDINNPFYRINFFPEGIELFQVMTFHIVQNYSLLEERDLKRKQAFNKLFDWADKYELDESIFPRDIDKLLKLGELDISNKAIKELPKELAFLEKLYLLNLSFNQLTTIPTEFKDFNNLRILNLESNKLNNIPQAIFQMSSLMFLTIKSNNIMSLSSSISNLKKLKYLCICQNQIANIPKEINELKNLEGFCMHRNKLSFIPETIGRLNKLKTLTFSNNYVEHIPKSIIDLNNLKSLEIENNNIKEIDLAILKSTNLNELAFDDNLFKFIIDNPNLLSKIDTINLKESNIDEKSNVIKKLSFTIDSSSWIEEIDRRENGCIKLTSLEHTI